MKEKNNLTPVGKTKKIIETLCLMPYEFGASDICNRTGINRSSVRRILNEFLEDSWIIQDSTSKKYKIGPMLYHIGMVYRSNDNAECKILEVMDDLSEKTKESIGYAVREGDKVISLYETEIHQPYKLNYAPGQFYPINKGCYGKCLMAYHDRARVIELLQSQHFEKTCPNTLTEIDEILKEYDRIKEQGFAISDEEIAQHLVAVGVPVFNSKGTVEACIVAAFLKGPDFLEKVETYIEFLKKGAAEIKKYLI